MEAAREEMNEIREKSDQLFEEKMKVEQVVDEKDTNIQQLEKELQRSKEEVVVRKMVIDDMGVNMLAHEKESADMATKLSLLKSQMMEHDTAYGMGKKYGCVKKSLVKLPEACAISFAEE